MRFAAALLLLGLVLCPGPAGANIINGRGYVSLAAWARANGYAGHSANGGTVFVLTNRTSRLIFNQDSADSTLNGINVRLSYPVAKGGFLSQLDAEKTVRPLIYAPKPSAKKITTICLDPGHGGRDTGFRIGHFFPRSEKTYTLALALELQRHLQRAGFTVMLTRNQDVYPELATRPDFANRHGADLFISLHFNSCSTDPSLVQGSEIYCITPVGAASSNDSQGVGAGSGPCPANRVEDKSLLLAYQVQRSLVRGLGQNDRSLRRARFEVLRSAQMPAILIEGGYMSNPMEGKRIFDANWRQQMAAAITGAILNYQKLTAPAPSPQPAAASRSPASASRVQTSTNRVPSVNRTR